MSLRKTFLTACPILSQYLNFEEPDQSPFWRQKPLSVRLWLVKCACAWAALSWEHTREQCGGVQVLVSFFHVVKNKKSNRDCGNLRYTENDVFVHSALNTQETNVVPWANTPGIVRWAHMAPKRHKLLLKLWIEKWAFTMCIAHQSEQKNFCSTHNLKPEKGKRPPHTL